jgi:hypothetical protein
MSGRKWDGRFGLVPHSACHVCRRARRQVRVTEVQHGAQYDQLLQRRLGTKAFPDKYIPVHSGRPRTRCRQASNRLNNQENHGTESFVSEATQAQSRDLPGRDYGYL